MKKLWNSLKTHKIVRPIGITVKTILVALIFMLGLAMLADILITPKQPHEIAWGVTFSQKMSQDFGLDWKRNLEAIVYDMKPSGLRLVAYWDQLQPSAGTWDFTDLDWQMETAAKGNVPVILSIGQKVPRWPECHFPSWLDVSNTQERQQRLLTHLEQIVNRYKDAPNLLYWQVENEPLLTLQYIDCPKPPQDFLRQESDLVRRLDPKHKTITSDSGQVGFWIPAAQTTDLFGITYYRKINNKSLGQLPYPYLPGRVTLTKLLAGKKAKDMMVLELQTEPWGPKQIYDMTLEDQLRYFSLKDFRDATSYATKTGFDTYYLWGAEWWYYLKQHHNHPEYWDLAKTYMHQGKQIPIAHQPATYSFPKDFLWGASTASHQVEGNTLNDWTEWEKKNAPSFATKAQANGTLPASASETANYISGDAADFYNRYKEDIALAKKLGVKAFRLSFEWSRIQPSSGVFDEKAIAHYQDIIRELKANDIEPFVTLWHYTLPTWFANQDGWMNSDAPTLFATYAQRMAKDFPEVTYWLTINEPGIYASHAYLSAKRPPEQSSIPYYYKALKQQIKAHRLAYDAMKQQNKSAQISFAQDVFSFEADKPTYITKIKGVFAKGWMNHYFLNRTNDKLDYLGLNYYFNVDFSRKDTTNANGPEAASDLNWRLYPQGIYSVLMDLAKYKKPIVITENGLADANDTHRSWYIQEVLKSVHQAIADGADVKGYLHWSFIDNFEWEKGFWPRFGLIEVDYPTQKRTPRPSAYVYSQIMKTNAVTSPAE